MIRDQAVRPTKYFQDTIFSGVYVLFSQSLQQRKDYSAFMTTFSIIGDANTKNYDYELEGTRNLIDRLGLESSRAQGMKHTITNFERFSYSSHRIYLLYIDKPLGFVKVGDKSLIYTRLNGSTENITTLALLDFYIDSNSQRGGYGKVRIKLTLIRGCLTQYSVLSIVLLIT